jgi:tRNA pseudouridine38-40 synthase
MGIMAKYIIKFSYDGSRFSGYQRGNGERSVEDSIQTELEKMGINSKIRSAARTDRGVSAISNVFSVEYDDSIDKLLGILNSRIMDMAFHSFAQVKNSFNPRHCTMKWYRYYIFQNINRSRLQEVLGKFSGIHDFKNYCRSDGRNTVRSISSIKVGSYGVFTFVDFYAQSFLWQQIRSIIAYAMQHAEFSEDLDPFDASTRYGKIAPPYPLILMDIEYESLKFAPFISRSKEKLLIKNFNEIRSRYTFLGLELNYLKNPGIFSGKPEGDDSGLSVGT